MTNPEIARFLRGMTGHEQSALIRAALKAKHLHPPRELPDDQAKTAVETVAIELAIIAIGGLARIQAARPAASRRT